MLSEEFQISESLMKIVNQIVENKNNFYVIQTFCGSNNYDEDFKLNKNSHNKKSVGVSRYSNFSGKKIIS